MAINRKNLTKKQRRQEIAIMSGDENKILLMFDQRTAHTLFLRGLNVTSAVKMSAGNLLRLKGIGPRGVKSIRKAYYTARGFSWGKKFTVK